MGNTLVREAQASDLGDLLNLFDELADGRRLAAPGSPAASGPALELILADPARRLVVAELDGVVVGTADLLIVPNLTHHARAWAVVENVIVGATVRRQGVGRVLMERLIEIARAAGCYKLQLHSGKRRTEAHAFYRSLGLETVSEGFKIYFEG